LTSTTTAAELGQGDAAVAGATVATTAVVPTTVTSPYAAPGAPRSDRPMTLSPTSTGAAGATPAHAATKSTVVIVAASRLDAIGPR
jgi:hypothetical protein